MIFAKCGVVSGGWCTNRVCGSPGCGLWKSIMRGWEMFA